MSMVYQEYGSNVAHSALMNPLAPRYVGLECEIEGIVGHGKAEQLGFRVDQDGSLRNSGYEYISAPITIPEAVDGFKKLHATIRTKEGQKFSNRTSIHVHVNCSAYELNQVRNIILLYALFEEAFFLMVESDRRDNIHCVPLTETYLPNLYRDNLNRLQERWQKYTALNIKPLTQYGTIEFRHMHGHDDGVLMAEWLGIINNLFNRGLRVPINRDALKEENLREAFNEIFAGSRLSNQWVLVRSLMVNQIIDVKLAVI